MEIRLMRMIFILITMVSVSFVFHLNLKDIIQLGVNVLNLQSHFLFSDIVSIHYSRWNVRLSFKLNILENTFISSVSWSSLFGDCGYNIGDFLKKVPFTGFSNYSSDLFESYIQIYN